MRHCLIALLTALLLAAPATAQDADATARRVEQLIKQLGADDFSTREQATEELWKIGEPAMAPLEEAVKGGDYEVVWRAEQILKKFRLGIFPDTPKHIAGHLENYSSGNDGTKRTVVQALLGLGAEGFEAVARLLANEKDKKLREYIETRLAIQATQFTPGLIAAGKFDEAARYLRLGAASGVGSAVQAYTSFVVERGQLDEAIKKTSPDDPGGKQMLAWLYRANGELDKAIDLVEDDASLSRLHQQLLHEAGRWAALAEGREKPDADSLDYIGYLGYEMAYHRLAGNDEAYRKAVDTVMAAADTMEANRRNHLPELLLLNDEIAKAMQLYRKFDRRRSVLQLLAHQHRYTDAKKLLHETMGDEAFDAERRMLLQLESIDTWQLLGDSDAANACLTATLDEKDAIINNGYRYTARKLLSATRDLRGDKEAAALAAAALAAEMLDSPKSRELQADVFRGLANDHSAEAAVWWEMFDDIRGEESTTVVVQKVLRVIDPAAKVDNFEAMVKAAIDFGQSVDAARRLYWYRMIAGTCERRGEPKLARLCLDAVLSSDANRRTDASAAARQAADVAIKSESWDAAAKAWQQVVDAQPNDAAARYALGFSRMKAGDEKTGRETMQRARLVAAASSGQAYNLVRMMEQLKRYDDLADLRKRIVRTGAFESWILNSNVGRMTYAYAAEGDFAKALLYDERARLFCIPTNTGLVNLEAHLIISARNHVLRARLALAEGRHDAAVTHAYEAMDAEPANIEILLQLVPRLLKHASTKQDAVELFDRQYKFLADNCRAFPDAASEHNTIAWLCARLRWKLDAAQTFAERAVKLAPESAGYLDTLAEVHFQKGNTATAIDMMKKCIELDPDYAYFQRQLKRFEAGDPTTDPEE